MLTVRHVFDDLMGLLWYQDANTVPVNIRYDLLNDIRSACQVLASCGEDYYGRTTLTQALSAGTSSYALEEQIQTVLEPVRNEAVPLALRRLLTRNEQIQFPQLFLESLSPVMTTGSPLAWWVESKQPTLTAGTSVITPDSVSLFLHICPTPDAAYTISFDAILQPPDFSLANLCDGSVVPVAHRYTESLFLPLARWEVTRHNWFTAADKIPAQRENYQRAIQLLPKNHPLRNPPDGSDADAARLPSAAPPQDQREAA